MAEKEQIAELEAAIVRWAKQVDELTAERDRLQQELRVLRERFHNEMEQGDQ